MVSVVIRKRPVAIGKEAEHAQGVGESPADAGRIEQPGERLVEVERDHAAEDHVEEHEGGAPETFAGEGVGQPEEEPDDDQVDDRFHEQSLNRVWPGATAWIHWQSGRGAPRSGWGVE